MALCLTFLGKCPYSWGRDSSPANRPQSFIVKDQAVLHNFSACSLFVSLCECAGNQAFCKGSLSPIWIPCSKGQNMHVCICDHMPLECQDNLLYPGSSGHNLPAEHRPLGPLAVIWFPGTPSLRARNADCELSCTHPRERGPCVSILFVSSLRDFPDLPSASLIQHHWIFC